MDDVITIDFLGDVNDDSKQKLGHVLWNWDLCKNCTGRKSCAQQNCTWSRSHSLITFWNLYKRMTDAYSPERLGRRPALSSHETLFTIIQKIKGQQTLPRNALLRECFEGSEESADKPPTLNDQNRAFNIAASILLLMDFGVLHDPANSSDGGIPNNYWRGGLSMSDFVRETFPRDPTPHNAGNKLASLTAMQLKKVGKLRLKATNDIRRHLVLNQEERVVWIFHQDSVMREILRTTESDPNSYALPRTLILEVLDTIHIVLFPPEPESYKLLDHLVARKGFDSALLSGVSTPYRKENDAPVPYQYFGERLAALDAEMQTPSPHGWLQRRLKRKSDTYMVMATLIGVCIAVMLGTLGLVVSTFQAWVAYQQWKHPVKDS
jgi:hypothetical protein